MINNKQSYKIPVIISVILHIFIFALLFLHFSSKKTSSPKNVQIINALAINESQISTQKPTSAPVQSVTEPVSQTTIRHIEQVTLKQPEVATVKTAMPIPAKPKEAVVPEEQNLELQEPKIDAIAEQKKHEEETKRKEEKRKTEIKKQEAQLAKKQREEEAKQLQHELATQKQQETKQDSDTSEENAAAESNSEKNQPHSAQTAAAGEDEVDKYKQQIIQSISRKWLMPETDSKELACQLLVHVAPGGVVLSVDIIKESGDPNLDRSARNAIMKASPLPVPESSELFDNFRALRLTFRPQGIISG